MKREKSLAATRKGNGPLVLLLHGIGGSRTAWDKVVQRLQSSFTCLAPDMPGYGDSGDPAPGQGLAEIVAAIASLLQGRPAHVVGVSFGGLAALALARTHPALVKSLVLADATLGKAAVPERDRRQWLEMRRALAADIGSCSQDRAAAIAAPAAPRDIVAEIAAHMRRARPDGYLAVTAAIADSDARPWLSDIVQPSLIICGEHDGVTGLAISRTLARELRHARLVQIPAAGHAPHIEQPDLFAREVTTFLENCTRIVAGGSGRECM